MKKKFLECPIHGLALFRCKRIAFQAKTKDKDYNTSYTEKCFRCISDGRYSQKKIVQKQSSKHISFR